MLKWPLMKRCNSHRLLPLVWPKAAFGLYRLWNSIHFVLQNIHSSEQWIDGLWSHHRGLLKHFRKEAEVPPDCQLSALPASHRSTKQHNQCSALLEWKVSGEEPAPDLVCLSSRHKAVGSKGCSCWCDGDLRRKRWQSIMEIGQGNDISTEGIPKSDCVYTLKYSVSTMTMKIAYSHSMMRAGKQFLQ